MSPQVNNRSAHKALVSVLSAARHHLLLQYGRGDRRWGVAVAESLVDPFRGRPRGALVLGVLRHAVCAVLDKDSYRDREQRMQVLRRITALLPHRLLVSVGCGGD